jgi:aryl-alcohol dehydrogenase-like predicted oxidoreductase
MSFDIGLGLWYWEVHEKPMDAFHKNKHAGRLQGMNYRRLGRTNLRVSVVGFGTCQLRLVPERQAIETLVRGLTMGVNIIHTSPEYEGADKLIAKALRESGVKQKVYVCSQAWGDIDHFERLFESTCEALGTGYLDLFGINSLYDLEMFGENVWGTGGMVEFLLRKKEEGRLGSIFCTTHGPLHHLHDRLKRNIFDAVMISYNALGFHVLTFNPKTLFRVAQPPPNVTAWEFEDIPGMRDRLFPLLKQLDIGVMVMKPFAGGLLSPGKAFP